MYQKIESGSENVSIMGTRSISPYDKSLIDQAITNITTLKKIAIEQKNLGFLGSKDKCCDYYAFEKFKIRNLLSEQPFLHVREPAFFVCDYRIPWCCACLTMCCSMCPKYGHWCKCLKKENMHIIYAIVQNQGKMVKMPFLEI